MHICDDNDQILMFYVAIHYSYMSGYPYNMDPAFGAVPMVAPSAGGPPEDQKLMGQPMIKEERHKESPSPNDNAKSQPTVCVNL